MHHKQQKSRRIICPHPSAIKAVFDHRVSLPIEAHARNCILVFGGQLLRFEIRAMIVTLRGCLGNLEPLGRKPAPRNWHLAHTVHHTCSPLGLSKGEQRMTATLVPPRTGSFLILPARCPIKEMPNQRHPPFTPPKWRPTRQWATVYDSASVGQPFQADASRTAAYVYADRADSQVKLHDADSPHSVSSGADQSQTPTFS